MVRPWPPCRLCTQAEPGAWEYWVSMVEVTGITFHSRWARWLTKFRPPEKGSVAVLRICRIRSMGSPPIAM